MDGLRKVFRLLNRYFIAPIFRLGLGPLVGNPLAGYIMVIKNIGRKSGKVYYTPVNYAIINGYIYCMAGFGRRSDWYLNLSAYPKAEIILPGRSVFGEMEEVEDSAEALGACKQIMKNAGFAAFLEGYNPWRATDDRFQRTLERAAILRFKPIGIANGPLDAGGWFWIVLLIAVLWLFLELT